MCEILLVVEKKLDKDPFKDIAIFFSILHRIFPVFFSASLTGRADEPLDAVLVRIAVTVTEAAPSKNVTCKFTSPSQTLAYPYAPPLVRVGAAVVVVEGWPLAVGYARALGGLWKTFNGSCKI